MARNKKKPGKQVHLSPLQLREMHLREKAVFDVFPTIEEKPEPVGIVTHHSLRPQPARQKARSRKFDVKAMPKDDALVLTVADVCRLLKISRVTLYRIEKETPLPGRVKLGGQVRYHRETLEQWLKQKVEGKQ